jgi:ATP-binding cassette, subfamily C (CFTR/MRP), member 1
MADLKEYKTPDTFTAIATQADGTTQDGLAEKRDSILPSSPRSETQDGDGTYEVERDLGSNKLAATESYAINASVDTTAEVTQPQTKPWYRTPNPLRWGGIPPIPDERIVSPEYKAGFLSLLIFDWITPMMVVSSAPYSEKAMDRC